MRFGRRRPSSLAGHTQNLFFMEKNGFFMEKSTFSWKKSKKKWKKFKNAEIWKSRKTSPRSYQKMQIAKNLRLT